MENKSVLQFLTESSSKAISEIQKGNVIGGLAIIGAVLVFSGAAISLSPIIIGQLQAISTNTAFAGSFISLLGITCVVSAAFMHIKTIELKASLIISYQSGINKIVESLAGNVKEGTVNSTEIPGLVKSYAEMLLNFDATAPSASRPDRA